MFLGVTIDRGLTCMEATNVYTASTEMNIYYGKAD